MRTCSLGQKQRRKDFTPVRYFWQNSSDYQSFWRNLEKDKIIKQIARVPKHSNACCDKGNVSHCHLGACCGKGEIRLQRTCVFSEASRNSSKNGLFNNGFEIVSLNKRCDSFKGENGPERKPWNDSVLDTQEERRERPNSMTRRRPWGWARLSCRCVFEEENRCQRRSEVRRRHGKRSGERRRQEQRQRRGVKEARSWPSTSGWDSCFVSAREKRRRKEAFSGGRCTLQISLARERRKDTVPSLGWRREGAPVSM